jgi:hypothetical protein
MPDLGRRILGKHVGVARHGRDIRAVVAGNAVLFILPAQQARCPVGVVRRMARDAGIAGHRGVTPPAAVGEILSVDSACALVDQSASGLTWPPLPRGIVAGQAQLPAGTVLHQKIQRHQVFGLHVRIVARRALDISLDQLHRSGGSAVVPLATSEAARSILSFKRQHQAERVRRLHVAAEDVRRIHRSAHGHLAIGHGGAPTATVPSWQLRHCCCRRRAPAAARCSFPCAGVRRVRLRGELLVPEAAIQPGVRRVTVGAGVGPGAGDGRFAARPQIMHAQHVARDLSRQRGSADQRLSARPAGF